MILEFPARARSQALDPLSTMPDSSLTFFAESVAADTTEYTHDCVVSLIAFGTGDPETGGHSWTFSRSSDDDWGVCSVREIQQATIYAESSPSDCTGRHLSATLKRAPRRRQVIAI